jgi:hypothetical protein
MGAMHRMTELPERRRPTDPRARRRTPRSTMVFGVAFASMLCAAILAALVINAVEPEKATDTAGVTTQGRRRPRSR